MEADINSKFSLFLVFLLIVACGETEQIGNKLNAGEIEYLRQRAARKCISETNPEFADFISSSNSTLLGYNRNDQEWDYKYSSSGKTHKIYVWKQTSSAVYFHIVTSETTPKHIFLKYSLAANNDLMREVQADGCAQLDYDTAVSSSSVTMNKDDSTFSVHNTDFQYKFFRTWTFNSSQSGFFGFLSYTLKKQYYNNDDETVSTPAVENDTHVITAVATPTDQSDDNYISVDYPNRFYCLITDYTTTHVDVVEADDATDSNLTCQNTDDTTDVTVGTETFNPDVELIAPFN